MQHDKRFAVIIADEEGIDAAFDSMPEARKHVGSILNDVSIEANEAHIYELKASFKKEVTIKEITPKTKK